MTICTCGIFVISKVVTSALKKELPEMVTLFCLLIVSFN